MESRHGGHRHRSLEHRGCRRPLDNVTADHGARFSAPSNPVGDNSRTRHQLAKATNPGRPVDVPHRSRGRSRERTPHRRHAHSEPWPRPACSESPSPRLHCKSHDFTGGNGNNHHPSPSHPKAHANQSQSNDPPVIPSLSASPTWKPNVPPDAAKLTMAAPPSNSSLEPLTATVSLSCLNEL